MSPITNHCLADSKFCNQAVEGIPCTEAERLHNEGVLLLLKKNPTVLLLRKKISWDEHSHILFLEKACNTVCICLGMHFIVC